MVIMAKKLENEFRKYWHPEFKDWHENIKGVYHISSVGCDHQDLEWDEHSGPCLRQTYWEYTDPIPDSDETEGNFEEGREHHEKLQKIIKKWKPNSIIEKPLAKIFEREDQKILLVGSIDVEYHHLFDLLTDTAKTKKGISIWDIKTASMFTMPKGKYDKNPTHFDQTKIYGTMDVLFDLHPLHNKMVRVKIIYVGKHNKRTLTQRDIFDLDEGMEKFGSCLDRAFGLDECLDNEVVPKAEPMKWCKYCKYLERCTEQGDVLPIMKYKKMVGLKVVDIE